METHNKKPFSGKRIMLFPYCHMDWAWCFSRRWHEARYARVLSEALDLADSDPGFTFFTDSIAESLEPFFERHPEALSRWARLIQSGRFAIVGGHYANIRPTTAPEETFIRNIEIGRRRIAEWFPGVSIRGYANTDTAIGHSQLPQILSLAGYEYYMTGRPEYALELEGVPKLFRWQGGAGSEILTSVQHYGLLVAPFTRLAHAGTAHEREQARQDFLALLQAQATLPLDTLGAFLGMDDERPRRDHGTDRPYDVPGVIAAWNETTDTRMEQGTPDRFVDAIASQRKLLPAVRGVVDPCDVGYNGPFGQQGLRRLRDTAAALLVEAEIYGVRAKEHGFAWPESALETAWERVCRATSHAVQYLFRDDVDAMRLDLLDAQREAVAWREDALSRLQPSQSLDAEGYVALTTIQPHRRRALVHIPVLRTDFTVDGYALAGLDDRPVVQQAVELRNPQRPGEWELLTECDLPACGTRAFKLQPVSEPPAFPDPVAINTDEDADLDAGPWRLSWRSGRLAQIQASEEETGLAGSDRISLLEPLALDATIRGWMTRDIETHARRPSFGLLRQVEFGPLRWRFQRRGRIDQHVVHQDITFDLHGRIAVETTVDHGHDSCFFALAMPCSRSERLSACVPFGVEPRELAGRHVTSNNAGGRSLERMIPGMFYARDWVQATGGPSPWALIVHDGDRYWRRCDETGALYHLLLRAAPVAIDGWVRNTELHGSGRSSFRHALVAGEAARSDVELAHRADASRFPVRACYTRQPPREEEWLRIEPAHIRMTACRLCGDDVEVRLVECGGSDAAVRMHFARPVVSARLTDLTGTPLPILVCVDTPHTVSFGCNPRQICTVVIRFREPSPRVHADAR